MEFDNFLIEHQQFEAFFWINEYFWRKWRALLFMTANKWSVVVKIAIIQWGLMAGCQQWKNALWHKMNDSLSHLCWVRLRTLMNLFRNYYFFSTFKCSRVDLSSIKNLFRTGLVKVRFRINHLLINNLTARTIIISFSIGLVHRIVQKNNRRR